MENILNIFFQLQPIFQQGYLHYIIMKKNVYEVLIKANIRKKGKFSVFIRKFNLTAMITYIWPHLHI